MAALAPLTGAPPLFGRPFAGSDSISDSVTALNAAPIAIVPVLALAPVLAGAIR
jgi:hypothetical protein